MVVSVVVMVVARPIYIYMSPAPKTKTHIMTKNLQKRSANTSGIGKGRSQTAAEKRRAQIADEKRRAQIAAAQKSLAIIAKTRLKRYKVRITEYVEARSSQLGQLRNKKLKMLEKALAAIDACARECCAADFTATQHKAHFAILPNRTQRQPEDFQSELRHFLKAPVPCLSEWSGDIEKETKALQRPAPIRTTLPQEGALVPNEDSCGKGIAGNNQSNRTECV